jgi:hypothetical protein
MKPNRFIKIEKEKEKKKKKSKINKQGKQD